MVFPIAGLLLLVGGVVVLARANPANLGLPDKPEASAKPAPSATQRPPWMLPPVSDTSLPGAQQCPDAGSFGAANSDNKTEVQEVKAHSNEAIRLLGPNRRVVIGEHAVMTAPVTICGDGATVLIVGSMKGSVLLQGSGVKIVMQDKAEPPPAWSTTNGRVFKCTTNTKDPATPHCVDFTPKPGAKPNG